MAFNYSILGFVFYSTIAALFIASHISDDSLYSSKKYEKVGFPFDSTYGGRLKFLTHIDIGIQSLYFGLSALNCLFGGFICKLLFSNLCKKEGKGKESKCSRLCNTYSSWLNLFYVSIVFPIGIFVSLAFWSIYFIDKQMVYPDPLSSIIPEWQNQIMHTLPAVGVLAEHLLNAQNHKYPSLFKGISITGLFVLHYCVWILYIGTDSGKWVYPVLKNLSPLYRGLFIASQVVLCLLIYKVGQMLHENFAPQQPHYRTRSSTKQSKETSPATTRSRAKKAN